MALYLIFGLCYTMLKFNYPDYTTIKVAGTLLHKHNFSQHYFVEGEDILADVANHASYAMKLKDGNGDQFWLNVFYMMKGKYQFARSS